MKYFTKEWCFGGMDSDVIEDVYEACQDYLAEILETLPFPLKFLVRSLNLHDGKIGSVLINKSTSELTLHGIFGDLEQGYYYLQLHYENVKNLGTLELESMLDQPHIDILSDEIELLNNGLYSHKMIFSNRKETEICFERIKLTIQEASPNDYMSSKIEFLYT